MADYHVPIVRKVPNIKSTIARTRHTKIAIDKNSSFPISSNQNASLHWKLQRKSHSIFLWTKKFKIALDKTLFGNDKVKEEA